ncbi:MAG: YjbQ family protein, partial [candidate division WOR-3 bacterium]
AHIKAAIIGSSRTLFIENGKLAFGTWQGIFFCEFDGPRTREIWVKIIVNA